MFGCIGRLGCLLLFLVLGVVAWFTRDKWLHRLTGTPPAATTAAIVWEPLTEPGAQRARQAVESLGRRSGPVFANVRPGDLASYVFRALQRQLPASANDTRAAVIGERLYVKSVMSLADMGGPQALGPLSSFLSGRDTVTFGGSFDVIEPGLAQYRIEDIKVGKLAIPQSMIPRIVGRMRKGGARERLAPNGLALVVPPSLGDVRIARGTVTLYRTSAAR